MTMEELLERVRRQAEEKDASNYPGFLAIQFNITGENGGVFYIELKDGHCNIEPYEYIDRTASLTTSMNNFIKLLDGKLDPVAAFTIGKIKADGDLGKLLEFTKLIK